MRGISHIANCLAKYTAQCSSFKQVITVATHRSETFCEIKDRDSRISLLHRTTPYLVQTIAFWRALGKSRQIPRAGRAQRIDRLWATRFNRHMEKGWLHHACHCMASLDLPIELAWIREATMIDDGRERPQQQHQQEGRST